MSAEIVPFVPKEKSREALIREARQTYDDIFPTVEYVPADTAPSEWVAPESDPA